MLLLLFLHESCFLKIPLKKLSFHKKIVRYTTKTSLPQYEYPCHYTKSLAYSNVLDTIILVVPSDTLPLISLDLRAIPWPPTGIIVYKVILFIRYPG